MNCSQLEARDEKMDFLLVYLQWRGQRVFNRPRTRAMKDEDLVWGSSGPDVIAMTEFWERVADEQDKDPPHTIGSSLSWQNCELQVHTDTEAMLYRMLYPRFQGTVKLSHFYGSSGDGNRATAHMPARNNPFTPWDVDRATAHMPARNNHLTPKTFRHLSHLRSLDISRCFICKQQTQDNFRGQLFHPNLFGAGSGDSGFVGIPVSGTQEQQRVGEVQQYESGLNGSDGLFQQPAELPRGGSSGLFPEQQGGLGRGGMAGLPQGRPVGSLVDQPAMNSGGNVIFINAFVHLTNLTSLSLDDCQCNEGRSLLSKLTKLRRLSMRRTQMDLTMDALPVLSTLTSLDIRCFKGATVLKNFPQLQDLSLSIAEEEPVDNTIPPLSSLTRLRAEAAQRGGFSAMNPRFDFPSSALICNPQLRSLDLDYLNLPLDMVESQQLSNLTGLTLVNVDNVENERLHLRNLRSLTLTSTTGITDGAFRHLSSLTHLEISGHVSITSKAFYHLPGLKSLICGFFDAKIIDAALFYLQNLTSLSAPYRVGGESMLLNDSMLLQFSRLVRLNVSGQPNVTNYGVTGIPTLRFLDVSRCPHIDSTNLAVPAECKVVKKMDEWF